MTHKVFEKTNKTRGVTLLELLIYIAILSGLVVVIADGFISLSKARGQSEARSEVNSAIRFASDILKRDIKNATTVDAPSLGVPASSLGLTVGGVPVVYGVSNGVLQRSENSVSSDITGDSIVVNDPIFTRIENFNPSVGISGATTTAIQVVMTIGYNSDSSDWTYSDTLRTTTTLR